MSEPTPTTPGVYVRRKGRLYWVAIVVTDDGAFPTETYALTRQGAARQGRRHQREVARTARLRTDWEPA